MSIKLRSVSYKAISRKRAERGLLEKGSFQKSPCSREFRDSRDPREPPVCGKKGQSDHFLEILEN